VGARSASGEASAAEATRKDGLTIADIERSKEQCFAAGENALRAQTRGEAKDEQIERLKRKVGELVLGINVLERGEQGPPFRPGTCDGCGRRSPGRPSAASAGCWASRARVCAASWPSSHCAGRWPPSWSSASAS